MLDKIKEEFEQMYGDSPRKEHIYGVVEFCEKVSTFYNLTEQEREKLLIASYSHDLFREVGNEELLRLANEYGLEINPLQMKKPILLHGAIAEAHLKREYGVQDESILNAVKYHTSGHPSLDKIGKIIVLADSLEKTRIYERVNELRTLVFVNLETAYKEVIRNKITYAVNRDLFVLPETLETWNSIVEK